MKIKAILLARPFLPAAKPHRSANLCLGLPAARFPFFGDNIRIVRAKSVMECATRKQFIASKHQPARDRDIEMEGGRFRRLRGLLVTRSAFIRECSDLNGMAQNLEGRKIILF